MTSNDETIVPGCWECPLCGFVLIKNNLYVKSGTVGPNTEPFMERCPNDGQIMHPETWKARCKRLSDGFEALLMEMRWLDEHCSFVADAEYNLGPFKIGELRKLAQAGLKADADKALLAVKGESPN